MQNIRMSGGGSVKGKERERSSAGGGRVVSEMDPDAPIREQKNLDTEDAVGTFHPHIRTTGINKVV